MARASEVYAGSFVTGAELQPLGQRRAAIIHLAEAEAIGQENDVKIILSLVTKDGKAWPRRVVLNKSNALLCAHAFGDDTDAWAGKGIDIWAEMVNFRGQAVPGIKLAPAPTLPLSPPAKPTPKSAPTWNAPAGGGSIEDDEIPFAACVQ